MMEPAVPKTTTQKLHVPLFCVIIINECQITMFSPCGTWSSLFQFTRLLKGKSIFQFSRAQMFFFFFALHMKGRDVSLAKSKQSGNLSPGVTVPFIYLASMAWYDESSHSWFCSKVLHPKLSMLKSFQAVFKFFLCKICIITLDYNVWLQQKKALYPC